MIMRGVENKNILDEFCEKFCSVVEKYCKYIVVSGFVAISSGRTRATEDIDIIIEKLDFQLFKKFHDDLHNNGFVCAQTDNPTEIFDYLRDNQSVRYTKKNSPLPEMEVKFVKDELDLLQIQTRVKLPLTGLQVWFSSVNMNIAFKEGLLKSKKDLKDAEHLRKVYPELVNEVEIKSIKKMLKEIRK